jgi:hypothetical protein
LVEIEKAMYQVVEWLRELNICLLAVAKYDLCEVKNEMFLGVESQSEIIFCLLVVP